MEKIVFEVFFDWGVLLRVKFLNDVILRILRKICFLLLDNFPFRIVSIFKLSNLLFIYINGDDALYKNIVSFITSLSTSCFCTSHFTHYTSHLIFHLSYFIFCISNFVLFISHFLFVSSVNCNLFDKRKK